MKYFARVVALNPYVEEEVTLSFGEYEICCFINEPNLFVIGEVYLVELVLMFFDDIEIKLSNDHDMSLTQIGNSFAYQLNGKLLDNKFIVTNLVFEDDLFYQYSYTENQFVMLKSDRINVEIIEPISHELF
ncbi:MULTISPECIES: hypothetical protein [Enterobacterales]|uniref:hypothetical protein n=1 Tax=Enterobacterales TaxID=91347 RepID=UPI0008480168|nr:MULTISPECIES: hypothetical protein [Enterobacterales]WOO50627.1 hypothetical protein R2S03_05420 [Hafnia alvei]MCT6518000.1 hypothetical protein [Proteus vulgaris]ODQ06024.1 hypothetical protein BGK50_02570 [Shigella sp. FC130]OEI93536.1 hypothetical protein BHE86_02580 [Shigella sp. FC1655]WPF05095.1 hypothetical protein SB028_04270 [Proteus vulgaris]